MYYEKRIKKHINVSEINDLQSAKRNPTVSQDPYRTVGRKVIIH